MRFDGQKLRNLRQGRKWDQHRLAEAARRHSTGITQSQISRYENGQEPSGRNALALASALGIDVRELYTAAGDTEDEESSSMPLTRGQSDAEMREAFSLFIDLMSRVHSLTAREGVLV